MPSYVAAYLESSPRDPLAAEESSRKAASRVNEAAPRKVGSCGSCSNDVLCSFSTWLSFFKPRDSQEYTIHVILCQLLLVGIWPTTRCGRMPLDKDHWQWHCFYEAIIDIVLYTE